MVPFGKSQDDEFQKSVKLINGFLKKIDPSVSSMPDRAVGDMLAVSTNLSYANVKMEVAVVKPKGQTRSDLIFSAAVCPLPKENLLPFLGSCLSGTTFRRTWPTLLSTTSREWSTWL